MLAKWEESVRFIQSESIKQERIGITMVHSLELHQKVFGGEPLESTFVVSGFSMVEADSDCFGGMLFP